MDKKNLWQKLLEIKKAVPYLRQDAKSFNYEYASPEQVLGAFNKLYNEHGIIVKTEVVKIDAIRISNEVEKKSKDKNKDPEFRSKEETLFTLDIEVTLINTDNPVERETYRWAGAGVNGDEKGFGSALTYAERYFFLKQSNVPTGKDDPDAFIQKHRSPELPETEEEKLNRYKASANDRIFEYMESQLLDEQEGFRHIRVIALAESPNEVATIMTTLKASISSPEDRTIDPEKPVALDPTKEISTNGHKEEYTDEQKTVFKILTEKFEEKMLTENQVAAFTNSIKTARNNPRALNSLRTALESIKKGQK